MPTVATWIRWLVPCLLWLAIGCSGSSGPPPDVSDEVPVDIVAAHTNGLVSREGPIQVRFVSEVIAESAIGTEPPAGAFTVVPTAAGSWKWASRQVAEFRPSDTLTPGERYAIVVAPAMVLDSWRGRAPFRFGVGVQTPAWELHAVGLAPESGDGSVMRWTGAIALADVAAATDVEDLVTARHDGATLPVSWAHEPRSSTFTVSGIARTENGSTLSIEIRGAAIGATRDEQLDVPVPGLNHFVVASVAAITSGDRSIEIRFSDPLDAGQDLRGLVRVIGRNDVRIERDANVVRLYATANWSTREEVEISGVRSARGRVLADASTQVVTFESTRPGVRFVGSGVILPSSAEPIVPLEVANARAIEVVAYRVYESNVPQFLQVNRLDGTDELQRVGTRVWSRRIEVPPVEGAAGRWVRVGLDATDLVRNHPHGLYRLEVHVERADILWECAEPAWEPKEDKPPAPWDGSGGDRSFWDLWSGEDDEGWWDWDHRDDPCHKAYYRDFSWQETPAHARRNLLVTDIGLTARQGSDGMVDVVATHLGTAQPLVGADLELLDFQLQPLAKARTDGNGFARLTSPDAHPFAVAATLQSQRSWLRLDRGEALTTAHLDVGGADVHEGLKGLIYGERGVWRPGDAMHLFFVLHDVLGKIPAGHPIEFQLRDPQGRTVDEQQLATSVGGFTGILTRTAGDAPTGRWTALVRVGGAVFRQTLRVEAIIPNRLRIDLPLVADGVGADDPVLRSTLSSRWLHGAIARDLAADMEVAWSPRATRFAAYDDFRFDAPLVAFRADPETIWEGTLDEAGSAALEIPLRFPEQAPGMLTATLRTRVFEPGGASSTSESSLDVSPYPRFIGLALPKGDKARGMLLTDTPHPVRIVALDRHGKPAGNGEVAVSVRKLSWRWWWEQGDETGGDAEYAEQDQARDVASAVVPLVDGKADWQFEIKYPDWGRYLVTATDQRTGGHETGQIVYIDWPGWAGRAQKDQAGGATQLAVNADATDAEVGRKVTLSFPMPKEGRAFVSLLTGSRVLSTEWVAASSGETATHSFVATPQMAPGVYAQVVVIQPFGHGANDAPLRLYGIVPVRVYDPQTRIKPRIETAAEWRPATTNLVSVSEGSGREMTYSLAVVDEGLLGLTRHKVVNPWDSFYAREALGVRSWDLFDDVAGAYGGTLEQLLAIGGGDEGEFGGRPKAQRFPPVVWVGGPYHLAPGATDRREVDLPHYVGEVRVMVVAGHQGAFGAAETSVPVRSPLMALATLPRVLGPGEAVDLPVSLFTSGGVRDVDVTIRTEGPMNPVGDAKRRVRFDGPGEQLATFRLAVGDGLGPARVSVVATGGGQTARHDIDIEVRHPGPPITRVHSGVAAAGGAWTASIAPLGLDGATTLTVEVSRVPPMDLDQHLDALLRYPHGCVEQTTSAAFPQVALDRLIDLSPAESTKVATHVKAGIERLRRFQGTDGSFGTWPGGATDGWSTSWVGHFLLEAERAGYPLPSAMRSQWVRYQRAAADRWVRAEGGDGLDQAYRLYTLALAGAPDVGAMNRLRDVPLSDVARWRLAAAWVLAGQPDRGRELIGGVGLSTRRDRESGGSFGSPLRDRALLLEALLWLGDTTRATTVAAEISADLVDGAQLTTHEAAWALIAMSRFAERSPSSDIAATVSMAGAAGVPLQATKPLARHTVPPAQIKAGTLSVHNRGQGPLFVSAVLRGQLPPGTEGDATEGLSVAVRYEDLRGNELIPDRIEQGTDFIAAVSVTNKSGRALSQLALSHLLPSGWEAHGIAPGPATGLAWRDVRDDRILSYFALDAGGSLHVEVPLTAAYMGRFALPPVSAEAMYDPTQHGRAAGQWVEVVSQRVD